ncbi:ArsR/SmtB family transcription factor [Deminuibacter soli]|uniref:ArsR family transcriptional regulator n=1 Tax=Deminuibacter soli TaxID=2291815 RepID=A0A3E1NRR8_9BACT|nr:metalloregulator ArsR/SmtB family transcription factor [Deminuibacter soli]RFM30641.1 ArsR family transcriptional regulator [Deminuibacter soli]
MELKRFEKISKALGDTNRVKILHHITGKGGCGSCSDINELIDLAQPSVSHHIKILIEAGLIEATKEGRNHKYTLSKTTLNDYIHALQQLRLPACEQA